MVTEQKRELGNQKDKELNTIVKAASRQGISPSAMMKLRWVVTLNDDSLLKAQFVVKALMTKNLAKYQHHLQPHPVGLVRCS